MFKESPNIVFQEKNKYQQFATKYQTQKYDYETVRICLHINEKV